jgi:hypothetical protein
MGRNYYLCVNKDTSDHLDLLDQAREMIKKGTFRSARFVLEELVDHVRREECVTQVHIGKSCTGGFTFDHHHWGYFSTREELDEWLKSGTIVDEENREISFDAFWKIVNDALKRDTQTDNISFDLPFSTSVDFS